MLICATGGYVAVIRSVSTLQGGKNSLKFSSYNTVCAGGSRSLGTALQLEHSGCRDCKIVMALLFKTSSGMLERQLPLPSVLTQDSDTNGGWGKTDLKTQITFTQIHLQPTPYMMEMNIIIVTYSTSHYSRNENIITLTKVSGH